MYEYTVYFYIEYLSAVSFNVWSIVQFEHSRDVGLSSLAKLVDKTGGSIHRCVLGEWMNKYINEWINK